MRRGAAASDQMTCRLGPAAAVAVGGGDDGVLQLLASRRDGAVAPTAAAAAPHASAAVAAAAAVAPGRRAGEVRVGLVPGLDGAVGATVARAVVVLGRLRVAAAALSHHLVRAAAADAAVVP